MITAIANQKGGVAKTTSTIALSGLLSQDTSCLAIDLDPQGNLTTGFGIDVVASQPTVYDVLIGRTPVLEAVVSTPAGVHVLPATIALAKAEPELQNQKHRFLRLRDQLKPAQKHFEQILIDCPPSMGLLTASALAAAHALIIPVQCQSFALKGLEGLLQTVDVIKAQLNPDLKILGVLPTMAEPNTLMTQEVLKLLRTRSDGIPVFEPVPKSVKFPESNLAGQPIHRYANEWKLVQPYRDVVKAMRRLQEDCGRD
jgi:chromosome partitioning protein